MNVLHITTDLGNGGAQSVLYSLITNSPSHNHVVIAMVGGGKYQTYLNDKGYTVDSLGMKRGVLSIKAFFRLCKLIRKHKPDVIQTWMYHANVFGGLAARCAMHSSVVWGIHGTKLEDSTTSWSTRLVIKASAWISRYVPKVSICCSRSAMDYHAELKYPRDKMVFVANGYDIHRFELNSSATPTSGNDQESLLETSQRTEFVTLARWAAQKDYPNLFKAVSLLVNKGIHDFHCTLAGSLINEENAELMEYLNNLQIRGYVTLLGPISTVPQLLQQSDYLVLPSVSGEAFPNVVAEAMLSGTPCIVTDVGDAAEMVKSTGWVAEPGNPEELAEKMIEARNFKQQGGMSMLQDKCRARAIVEFPVEKMVAGYERVWACVLGKQALDTCV